MRRSLQFMGFLIARGFALFFFILSIIVLAFAARAGQRVYLAPKFVPGETLGYRVEMRMTTTGNTTTPIANPEGASKLSQTIRLFVRLKVLDPPPGAQSSGGQVRFRATYEKSQAKSESDALNPDQPSLASLYARLEGQSIEFTMEPNGQLTGLKGLEDIFPDRSVSDPILSWVPEISAGSRFPRDGLAIGQKWSEERPLEGLPLSRVIWRTESTYLRDERCGTSRAATGPGRPVETGGEICAVILTDFHISRRGSPQSNDTPEDYLRNGLRTSGTWTGTGESLDSFSLASGLLQSSTQTSAQNMDYEIRSAGTGSSIHRVGKVQTQSEIALAPPSDPSPGPGE